ncbi:hypothetical protein EMIT0P253_30207 [Pseudomonas sp. IT-P253]
MDTVPNPILALLYRWFSSAYSDKFNVHGGHYYAGYETKNPLNHMSRGACGASKTIRNPPATLRCSSGTSGSF